MGLDRREFLQCSAVILGASLSPGCVSAVLGRDPEEPLRTEQRVLSGSNRSTLERMVERILPATDTPGALDAGVPDFIEFVLAEGASAEVRATVAEGLAGLDGRAQSLHGAGFTALNVEQQDGLLREAELTEFANAPAGGPSLFGGSAAKPFFASIKEWTVVGFLTSEIGVKHFRDFSHMPGRFDGCVVEEPGAKPWLGRF